MADNTNNPFGPDAQRAEMMAAILGVHAKLDVVAKQLETQGAAIGTLGDGVAQLRDAQTNYGRVVDALNDKVGTMNVNLRVETRALHVSATIGFARIVEKLRTHREILWEQARQVVDAVRGMLREVVEHFAPA
ncbi:unnamed protein product [Peniophora sp. CBMAI 1063]|nr:unnamed protein product [Peniophora sp. CBMAI 1063]